MSNNTLSAESQMLDSFGEEIPRNIKCHLTIIKWIGVILILSTCALPGVVLISVSHCPPEVKPVAMTPNLNQSACVYVKQYSLRSNTFATVCNIDGQVFMDIRRFVNGSATQIGIQLSMTQWLSLKQMTPQIDQGIAEARTYWKTLKNL